MKKDDIIGGVLLLVAILAFGAFFLFAQHAPQLSYGPVEIAGSAITATAAREGEVEVIATLVKPGFVTVHRSIGGAPGPIIGISGYIDVGTDVEATVALSEFMEPGMTYIALLHVDNGDQRFVTEDDMPVTSNGISVRADGIGP